MTAPPLFIATKRFDPSDGEEWQKYIEWAKIPALVELVSLDSILCQHLVTEFRDDDWRHNVQADFRLSYFYDLDYLKQRVADIPRRNILGLYRNPDVHIEAAPAPGAFRFMGYDLIEEATQISALSNCGGFLKVFRNEELNSVGLIDRFERASEVKDLLTQRYPEEPHAHCEMYAIWRLNDSSIQRRSDR